MIQFEEAFFRGETREGFYVDETMKRFWAASMETLMEIDRICERHGLTYYADWGTLLGTVRHKGWVPWDDDMDISMLRPDYEKLIRVLPEELYGEYGFSYPLNDETYRNYMLKIRNANFISDAPEHMSAFHGCPFVTIVDVFPLDVIPRDPVKAEQLIQLHECIVYATVVLRDAARQEQEKELLEMIYQKLEQICNVELDRSKNMRNQLWRLETLLHQTCDMDEGDEVTVYPIMMTRKEKDLRFKKEWYAEGQRMPFENISISVPKEAHRVLTVEYGDYNVRVKNASAHGYPVYKRQIELLRQRLEKMERR